MATRAPTLRREEAAGLVLALAAHAALVTWLALKPPAPAPLPIPERMTVTISDEVALQSTSPRPAAEAAPAVAPVLAPDPVPDPAPEPRVEPRPAPPPVARAEPKPLPPKALPPKPLPPKPLPPKPVPVAKPVSPAKPGPAAKPQPVLTKSAPSPARPAPARPVAPARSGGGAMRFGDAFKDGVPGGANPSRQDPVPPAQTIGPAVRSALSGAIARQLKPKWVAPQGAEADQLVTVLSWDLNPDGTLAGPPRLVSQSGKTDANRPQAERHVEQAMRAVRLAAPFDLPSELYPAWKRVKEFRFDRKLSQ